MQTCVSYTTGDGPVGLLIKYNLYSLLDEDMSPICISVYRKFNITWTVSSGIMSRLHKAKKSLSSAALLEAS